MQAAPELSAFLRVDPLVMTDGDAELMSRVQTGDRGAFAVLVDRHKHRLVNYLTTLTRDRDRAEELAQDTFIRLFESADRYEERGQLVPFLFRIATNLLRSEDRKKRRREVLLHMFSGNGHHRSESGTSPQEELLRKEVGLRVTEALAGVPLRYRSPLVLREMEGWSYRDIASALNCREGTVKSRITSRPRGAPPSFGALLERRSRMTALHPLHDEELDRLLKDMSRQDASSDFTDKVLERLASAPPRRTAWGPRTAWAVAAAVAVGIWFGQMVRSERREQVRAAENLEQMQNEYRELRSELDRLRRLTSDVEPVLELGGTERMDFIFDLRVLADEQSERSERRAEPVSHSPR